MNQSDEIHAPEFLKTAGRILNAGQSRSLALTGNIYDLFPVQNSREMAFVPLPESLIAQWDLSEFVLIVYELNGPIRFVREADAYVRADIGLSWQISPHATLDIWGQNLTDEGHAEFENTSDRQGQSEIPRAGYIQLRVRY